MFNYRDQKKWEQRHFQIVLALLSRPSYSLYGDVKPISMNDVLSKADKLVELLKEREMNNKSAF